MADPYRKVRSGEKFSMPAQAYNAFIDAARAHQQANLSGDVKAAHRQSAVIKIRNNTGNDLPRFSIVGLTAPIIGPADNLDEFKRQVTFDGVTPSKNEHNGRFVVLLEPLALGAVGMAVAAGVVAVRLFVNPAQLYDHAEVIDGVTGLLRNVPAGPARVLWVESGPTQSQRWAVIRIGESDPQAHVFVLSNIPDASGLYPGVVQRFDVNTGLWVSLFPCRVMDINQ